VRAPKRSSHCRISFVALALALAGSGIAPVRANPVESIPVEVAETLEAALLRQATALDPRVLMLALDAHDSAQKRGLLSDAATLTVIDYSRASVEPRFWVFDLPTRKLLFEERVAHGRNSGENFATHFSNRDQSLETSLGLFVTRDVYYGKHGESLRLVGLEPGVNDRALERAIVIHGAEYVSANAIASLGFLGRSWGCPALSRTAAPHVIERLQGGSAVFAYYPDRQWLSSSRFLPRGSERMLDAPPMIAVTTPAPLPASMSINVPDEAPRAPVTYFPLRVALMS
jgi:L,D-transpeptidase-like protein